MFNEHLKRIRKVSKKTQQELAEYLNISTQSVSKWEKGTALPSIEFLPKMAEFFSCSINAFFSDYELQIYEQFEAIEEEQLIELLLATINSNCGTFIEEKEEIEPEETLPVESMFLPALYNFLKENDKVSIAALQRRLNIGYALGGRIFDALINMGIINRDSETRTVCVLKEKIDLLLPFIEKKEKKEA